MMIKYRAHEVAKDFGKQSKEILDILHQHTDSGKKAMTALDEEELNVIFDVMTSTEGAVDSFEEYFRSTAKKEKPAPRVAANAQQKAGGKAEKPDSAPKPKEEKPVVIQARTKGEVRHVNTRGGDVELDKYNEKYDRLATATADTRHNSDRNVNKQKLKQKSRQYRRQGGRPHKHETEAERLRRIAAERAKKPPIEITVGEEITVGDLAAKLKRTAAEVIKKLFSLGIMATVNETIDFDTAAIVASEMHAKVTREVVVTIEDRIIDDSVDEEKDLVKRAPVVVVMGHVDHGKTSLLDAIRNTSVTSMEAGGITQHIGAYRVRAKGEDITFLDTPGHAAFTSMRARGAQATDIAVLVVAADDGIMPQTVEAINHAKAANVSIIVAINKMDKPGANPEAIKQQLTEYDLVPEEWGGDTICVPVSAKTGENIDKLLETILLVAEVKELKANPNRAARGVVIEAKLDKGKGPIATFLVQNGTLNVGDVIVAGKAVGRIRVMANDKGERVEHAGPSVPVEVMGMAEVPDAGDIFDAVSDEKLARTLVEQRKQAEKEEHFNAMQRVTLDNLFDSIQDGERKDLNIIVKADVQGSVEAVRENLLKLSNEEVKVNVIHGAVGAVSESDVMLANASNAIIVGFNVLPNAVAKDMAEREGVDVRMYRVIYDCIEEIQSAIKGMLEPKLRECRYGSAEVRQVYKITGVGAVAGAYVLDGKIVRNSQIRVVRDGIIIAEDAIASLKRFKDDAKEVAAGFECGIGLEKFNDIKEGDVFESFSMEEYRD